MPYRNLFSCIGQLPERGYTPSLCHRIGGPSRLPWAAFRHPNEGGVGRQATGYVRTASCVRPEWQSMRFDRELGRAAANSVGMPRTPGTAADAVGQPWRKAAHGEFGRPGSTTRTASLRTERRLADPRPARLRRFDDRVHPTAVRRTARRAAAGATGHPARRQQTPTGSSATHAPSAGRPGADCQVPVLLRATCGPAGPARAGGAAVQRLVRHLGPGRVWWRAARRSPTRSARPAAAWWTR